MARLAVVALSMFVSTIAHAEPHAGRKHRETARWLSLGPTLGSLVLVGVGAAMTEYSLTGGRGYGGAYLGVERNGEGLMIAGAAATLFTPSLGEWYAGDTITTGMKLRATGVGLGLIGLAAYSASGQSCQQWGSECIGGQPRDPHSFEVPAVIGAGVYLAGIVYDLVAAPSSADRHNAHELRLVPEVIPTNGGTASGVGIAGRF